MTTSRVEKVSFNKHYYHEQVSRLWTPTLHRIDYLIYLHFGFHAFFLFLAVGELLFFLSSFVFFSPSMFFGIVLASFCFTIFSYLVLRLYFQTKKTESLLKSCEDYLKRCKEIFRYQEEIPEHHIALANAAQKLAAALEEKEYGYGSPPPFLISLSPILEKFSCFCCWKDFHKIKEFLLNAAIEEHLKAVKCEPTNLEIHAALANVYVMLSGLYADPRKQEGLDEERWIPKERYSSNIQEKFRKTAECAIEEFKILNDYAPNDPWVHIQLAYSYHDLQMPEEEIQQYEIIHKLLPQDQETLFKLGMLYFQQRKNAQGLRVYALLKRMHYKKAENLIKFYGTSN